MKRLLCSLAIFGLSLLALDMAVAVGVRGMRLPDRVVDIQHPTTLSAKLDRLRSAPGPKIVLVGDSLIYGGILEEFGDPDWREHGLGEQLAAELQERPGNRPFVMNLGINGALPADLEYLVPLVVACDVDLIILDVHLRPFSSDFSPPERQISRPWLRDLSTDGAGHLADRSAVLRNRMLVQENILATRLAKHPVLRLPIPVSETDDEIQSLVKLAQLKNRLKVLDLGPDGPQSAALQRLLKALAARGQRHIVFYAKENPSLLFDVMDPDDHAAKYDRVVQLVRGAQGPAGTFVPPVAELTADHFVDFTHLNAEGYRILARRLAREIK